MKTMQQRFGVFSPLFDSGPVYLELLRLRSPNSYHAVSRVLECSRLSSDLYLDIGNLLDEEDWRPQLVAAVALSALSYNRVAFTKLWNAFDSGSWVVPQLAVVAYLRDPEFADQARGRVRARCPVDVSRSRHPLPVDGSPLDETSRRPQSAKSTSALIYLLTLCGPSDWITNELTSPDLTTLLMEDVDNTPSIAESWLVSLESILRSLATKTD